MVERRAQAVDLAAAAIDSGIDRGLSNAALRLAKSAGRLRPPERRLAEIGAALADIGGRMGQIIDHKISLCAAALDQAGRLLDANSFERVLDRGFALVAGSDGKPLKRSAEAAAGADVSIRFADNTRAARLDPAGPSAAPPPKPKRAARAKLSADGQDSLF